MGGDFDDEVFPEAEGGFPIASLTGKGFESSKGNHFVVPIRNFICYEISNPRRTIHIRS